MRGRLTLVAVALAAAVAGCGGSSSPSAGPSGDSTALPTGLHFPDVPSHNPKPSFHLHDTAGKPYDFVPRTQGKVTLLYFGYTHCPDECPTSMATAASAIRQNDPAVADQVATVFVTTDPWRDKPPVLRRWLDRFSSSFVGLTGTPQQIRLAEVAVGMPPSMKEPAKKSDGAGRYAVDHFAAVFVYSRDGRLVELIPSEARPSELAADLKALVEG